MVKQFPQLCTRDINLRQSQFPPGRMLKLLKLDTARIVTVILSKQRRHIHATERIRSSLEPVCE